MNAMESPIQLYTVPLPQDLAEWGESQPGGLARLLPRLMTLARENGASNGQNGTRLDADANGFWDGFTEQECDEIRISLHRSQEDVKEGRVTAHDTALKQIREQAVTRRVSAAK